MATRYFLTGDHEPLSNIYPPDGSEQDEYEQVVHERNKGIKAFMQGVDVFIVDAQYTEEEYVQKRGWGGAFEHGMRFPWSETPMWA